MSSIKVYLRNILFCIVAKYHLWSCSFLQPSSLLLVAPRWRMRWFSFLISAQWFIFAPKRASPWAMSTWVLNKVILNCWLEVQCHMVEVLCTVLSNHGQCFQATWDFSVLAFSTFRRSNYTFFSFWLVFCCTSFLLFLVISYILFALSRVFYFELCISGSRLMLWCTW